MEDYEVRKWAGFGKATAWTLGIAATLGAVYGVGAIVYSQGKETGIAVAQQAAAKESRAREESLSADYNGKINAANQAKDQLVKNQEAVLKGLVQEGRLIPEDSCLRYAAVDMDEVVSGAKCGPLEARLSWTFADSSKRGDLKSFTTSLGDNKVIFTPETAYRPATVDFQERKKEVWQPYNRK